MLLGTGLVCSDLVLSEPEGNLSDDVTLDESAAAVTDAEPVDKTPAERINEADATVREEDARQARQNTLWRRILFWGVSSIVAAVVIADVVVIWVYLAGGYVDPIVLATWFASNVAQVIGLLLVITRHLFPDGKK